MLSANAICAVTLAFIVGMVWLRTRMHYRRGRGRIALTRAGRIYFAALVAVLVLGWLAAPAAGMPRGPPRPALPRPRAWGGFSPPTTRSFPCIPPFRRAWVKASKAR